MRPTGDGGGAAAGRRALTGWGRTAPSVADVVLPGGTDDVVRAVTARPHRGVVARGLGRAYGDAAQNAGGTVLPFGLFVPVTPGTRQVTVGGAVAADVHGKDHHVRGSFARHVEWLDLLLADGSVRRVGPDRDADLFWATTGGMGLTGVVLRACLRMQPVETSRVVVDTERTADLDALMDRMTADDDRYTYSVAWVDCLARGRSLGRSVLTRGWPARRDQLARRDRGRPLAFDTRPAPTLPVGAPVALVNRASVRLLNEAWFRRAPRGPARDVQGIAPFFHPLDVVDAWPRVYGPRGFVQYQLVVPPARHATVRAVLALLQRRGLVVSLAVLKRFGPGTPGPLSFPTEGWTLALDLPVVDGLGPALDRLDDLVLEAGGRLYLAKDSRAAPSTVHAMYPGLDRWREVRRRVDPEGVFASDLSRRLEL